MSNTRQQTVVGIGEVLWDCFANERRAGGAPANVAFQAAQLGLKGALCSRVGPDKLGDELLSTLNERGLDTRYLQRDARRPTGSVTVDASRPDHPRYTIHEDAAWDALEWRDDWNELLRGADAVCFGTLAQRTEQNRATLAAALQTASHALRVYDINLRSPFYERSWIETSLHSATIVKLNDAEATELSEMLSIKADDNSHMSEALLDQYELDLVCITRGEHGCLLRNATGSVEIPGRTIRLVDAVGAGDAFTAALIYSQLQDWPLTTCATFANEVGSLVASQAGAMPKLSDEFAKLIEKYR